MSEALARAFHDAYERLAPSFGYETRKDTRAFDPATPNGRLMIAVADEIEIAGPDKVLRCAFCGEAYPDGTPTHKSETLAAHVRVCTEHPIGKENRQMRAALEYCRQAMLEAAERTGVGKLCEQTEAWRIVDAALNIKATT